MKKIKNIILSALIMVTVLGAPGVSNTYTSFASNTTASKQEEKGGTGVNYSKVPVVGMEDDELTTGLGNEDRGKAFSEILTQYRSVVTFVSGIALISMVLFFIFNLIALGNSKGNPQERQKAITGLIVSGIATAGLGSVTLITTLFYNFIQKKE